MIEYRYTWWRVILVAFLIAVVIEIIVTGVTPETIVVIAPIVYYTGAIAGPVLVLLAIVWLIRKRNINTVGRRIVWGAFVTWSAVMFYSIVAME